MSTGGHKPGLVAKVTVDSEAITDPGKVLFKFAEPSDANYFQVGKEYVAFFMPAPPDNPPGGGNEQGNG